jgi:glycosyltransferase involved in cell wall biosynthesis
MARRFPQIDAFEGPLSDAKYEEILSSADFVILPYRRASYGQQSSMIAFEALAVGKPLIITEGLSFVPLIAARGVALQVPDGDPGGLANAIQRMVQELPGYSRRATQWAEKFKTEHSIDHVIKHLLSLFDV